MTVAMKFTAPSSDEVIRQTIPTSQNVWPSVGIVRLGRPTRNEETNEHDQASNHVKLVAGHVDARKGHVRRADLERNQVVAEGGERQRHDGQEHHDRAVHGAKGVVEVRRDHPFGRGAAEQPGQQRSHHGHWLARMGDLPAHHQHQAEAEQQKTQGGQTVLNADDLVVRGEDVCAPETRLFVARFMNLGMRNCLGRCLHVHLTLSNTIAANNNGRYSSET
jgi:hypothetical protein